MEEKIRELAEEVTEKVLYGMNLNVALKQAHRKLGSKSENSGKQKKIIYGMEIHRT